MKTTQRIKICGITRVEDALAAEAAGAAAVGFVLYPKSPRYIEPEQIREITNRLGPFIAKVGVFVNETPETIRQICVHAGLTAVQLHGDESPEVCGSFGTMPVVKAFRVGDGFDPAILTDFPIQTYLLDTYVEGGCRGGTGKVFDWQIAKACNAYGRIILAGGITPANIAEAIGAAVPWGIDVSSGVESSPGVKDHDAIVALFDAVKECTE